MTRETIGDIHRNIETTEEDLTNKEITVDSHKNHRDREVEAPHHPTNMDMVTEGAPNLKVLIGHMNAVQ